MKMTVAVHGGTFHADDVFSVALLQLIHGIENITVLRTRDEAVLQHADLVADVGGVYDADAQRFDHHQQGSPVRKNGIPYAAFGLLWRHSGETLTESATIAQIIDETLVQHIDACDTGSHSFSAHPDHDTLMPITIDMLIRDFYPDDLENESSVDAQFMRATAFGREIIERTLVRTKCEIPIRQRIENVIGSYIDGIPIFDEYVPSELFPPNTPFDIIVTPYDKILGSWKAQALRIRPYEFPVRVLFPESWAGLRGKALQNISGVADAEFCHLRRSMAFAQSAEGARALAEQAEKII